MSNQVQFTKDPENKKMTITRMFDAPVEKVWRAWTESQLLDQWWAPKPWRAETKAMDFRVGGQWLYAMVGPEGEKHWSKAEYLAINNGKSFEGLDMFCDEEGNRNPDFPVMRWSNEFHVTEAGTKMVVEITYDSEADMEKMLEMGFQEGFTMGLENLDELLASQAV